jgi:uncharacterized membrane protein
MASLVVLKFDTPDGAEKGFELAQSLQKQQLLQLIDAAIVAWPKGKKRPKTRQAPLAALGALDGAFWGTLIGFIFFVPFFGMAPFFRPKRCRPTAAHDEGRRQPVTAATRRSLDGWY